MTQPLTFIFLLIGISVAAAQSGTPGWPELRPLVEEAPLIGTQNGNPLPVKGPVIVTFFASWCPPCTDEFRYLNDLKAIPEFADNTVVAINLFEDFGGKKNPTRMKRFLRRTQPQFQLYQGSEEIRSAFGQIDRIPTVIIYGKSGDEIWRFVHERDAKKTHATLLDFKRVLELDR